MKLNEASPFTPYIKKTGSNKTKYSKAIKNAFSKALEEQTKLPDWILNLHGMSGKRYRIFINNLISEISDARYLEIGSWTGSTACSALYGNKVYALCIDNWSQFGNVNSQFKSNIGNTLKKEDQNTLDLQEKDFREVDYTKIGKFNVYFFDGPHEIEDQYDGLKYALPALDDTFIFIVDDWNDPRPREGTEKAIGDLGIEILYSLEIRTSNGIDNVYPNVVLQDSHWHNGYLISVCRRNNKNG